MKHKYERLSLVLLSVSLVMVLLSTFFIVQLNSSGIAQAKKLSANAVRVEFYVMSQCPYGTQVEDAIKPVLDALGQDVDFRLDFIADVAGTGFDSLHGPNEVQGNIVQLCAQKHEPARFMDMVVCMNKNMASIPNNWEQCASGMNVAKIKGCYEGEEGKQLLRESIARSQQVQAQGSPTMFIAGTEYQGGRDSNSFLSAICSNFAQKPAGCSNVLQDTAAPLQGGC